MERHGLVIAESDKASSPYVFHEPDSLVVYSMGDCVGDQSSCTTNLKSLVSDEKTPFTDAAGQWKILLQYSVVLLFALSY